jgi:hypothetical protein
MSPQQLVRTGWNGREFQGLALPLASIVIQLET